MKTYMPFVILVLCLCSSSAPAEPEKELITRSGIVGYASNIDAFHHYSCRFKTTKGTANTEVDAKNATGSVDESCEALFVKDGDREALEIFGATRPPKPTAAESKAAKGGVGFVQQKGFVSEKYLKDGNSYGSYLAPLETLHLRRGDSGLPAAHNFASVYSPLYSWYSDSGRFGPDRMLAQPATYTPTFLGERVVGDRHLVGIRFDGQVAPEDGSARIRESWFDPDRGYLPVEYRTWINIDKSVTRSVITESKEFRPGRFFPMRLITWWHDRTNTGKWKYHEMMVLKLEVERRPTKADFTIIFPAGTAVSSPGRKGYFVLKQDERVSPGDLDELFDKLDRSVAEPRMDTGIEHTADQPKWRAWAAGVGGVVLLLLGAFLWWRKRRNARRSP
jgi:hypothetical protein